MIRVENIGTKIRVERAKRNMLQRELAEKVGVSQCQISAWEKGRFEPSLFLFFKICAAFDMTSDEFMECSK